MRRLGFLAAVTAAILFGVGGTFAQFLFQHRGFGIGWLVTMRLLGAGSVLLLLSALRQGRGVFAIWRSHPATIMIFGLIGMMPVQYTYMAAIAAANTATATVLQFTAPAMIAVWFAVTRRRLPQGRALGAIALAMAGTALLVTHGRPGALSISSLALFWGLASAVAAAFNSIQPAALRLIGAERTSLLTCAEPLSAALLAVLWLNVPWSGMDWLGMACVLAAIALLARTEPQMVPAEKVT